MMEADDDKDFTNTQQYFEYSDQNLYEVGRPCRRFTISNLLNREPNNFPKTKRRIVRVCRSGAKRYWDQPIRFMNEPREENPTSYFTVLTGSKTEFKKREITTIPEEVFSLRRQRLSKTLSTFKEKKNLQEKVASLAITVERLKEMCLTKPEVLQDSVPEEVMKLMSSIQI